MPNYTTPGVYIEETSGLPPGITSVASAIPVFIGYTQQAQSTAAGNLLNIPQEIYSLADYVHYFGGPRPEKGISIRLNNATNPATIQPTIAHPSKYLMYYALQAYFNNGGGHCYIVSVGNYTENEVIAQGALLDGLAASAQINEATLILFPDGINTASSADYYAVISQSLALCGTPKNRFTICDVYMHKDAGTDDIATFRNHFIGRTAGLSFGAAYYPYLQMNLGYHYELQDVQVSRDGTTTTTLDRVASKDQHLYTRIKAAISRIPVVLPASASVAGIYVRVDNSRGVWKAPANVDVSLAIQPIKTISQTEQESLNVHASGLSVNAVRNFPGRGTLVWGARTLAGNDTEWRYIAVRRFFNMVASSIEQGTQWAVFEPNDANTWGALKSTIDSFLYNYWRQGALSGSKPEEAYFVKVGLGATMTALDINRGKLIIEIGMAVVRPSEFIVLKQVLKMQL